MESELNLDEYISWAISYEKQLELLEADLSIISNGSKIFIAIDFCDLREHTMPYIFDPGYLFLRDEELTNEEIGRCGLFYLIKTYINFR